MKEVKRLIQAIKADREVLKALSELRRAEAAYEAVEFAPRSVRHPAGMALRDARTALGRAVLTVAARVIEDPEARVTAAVEAVRGYPGLPEAVMQAATVGARVLEDWE